MTENHDRLDESQKEEASRFSYPTGTFFVVSLLLAALIHAGKEARWGLLPHLAFLVLIVFVLREALSRKQYEKVKESYPAETRRSWTFNWLLFGVVLPTLVWLLFGLPVLLRP